MRTKHTLAVLAAALALTVSAQGATLWDDISKVIGNFFNNAPTNTWEVGGYGIYISDAEAAEITADSFGGGARVQYKVSPSLGAALDLSYARSSWTFASLAFTVQGGINFGQTATLAPYVFAGPGWNIKGPEQSIVAVTGGGADLDIKALKWFKFFGEYRYITTTDPQDQIVFGVKVPL